MNKEIKLVNNVYDQISQIIELRKYRAKIMVNSEIIAMNWSIGKCLEENILRGEKAEYGQKVIEVIGNKLQTEYGNGFNKSTLFRMIKFYNEFPNAEKVATLSQQLSWSHFVELLPIKDETKREFYTIMSINENWDVRTLRERKKSMLYERTLISKKPEETIKNDLVQLNDKKKMSIDLFLKDPYVLDFLDLKNTFSEKDLENAILVELEQFILEMGTDFAFLARQKHFILDNKDYYIDLLFYHRTLRRLVMIELKLGEFEPDYKGQVELYLKWLDKNERAKGEEPPLALILCAEKSDETIKLMDLDKGNIRVAQYLTKLPPKDLLEKKLKMAISRAKGLLDNKK
ncbi:MAG: DUF1016 family protein [Clostridia bacterium]|nr:DUF1016 family protein [Clostridia bacterium]